MEAEIIATGSELLAGAVTDTNSAFLARKLRSLGWKVQRIQLVSDAEADIVEALLAATARAKLVVLTGGLGPTRDDLTREAVARAAGVELVLDQGQLARLEAFFQRLGRPIPATNRKQAYRPAGSTVIPNEQGTAPGFVLQIQRCSLMVFPGVPHEMRHMVDSFEVIPRLNPLAQADIDIVGVSEAGLDERVAALGLPSTVTVGTQAGGQHIRIRLEASSDAEIVLAHQAIWREFGAAYLGFQGKSLEQVVIEAAVYRKLQLACAESCTGGMVGARLTDVAGSSAVFLGGVIAYANDVKREVLGVDAATLEQVGAVSPEVAEQMARGVRERLGADLSVAVTGIAGPGGGTADKPVGLVYLALAWDGGTHVIARRFLGDRGSVRRSACKTALDMLRRILLYLPALTND